MEVILINYSYFINSILIQIELNRFLKNIPASRRNWINPVLSDGEQIWKSFFLSVKTLENELVQVEYFISSDADIFVLNKIIKELDNDNVFKQIDSKRFGQSLTLSNYEKIIFGFNIYKYKKGRNNKLKNDYLKRVSEKPTLTGDYIRFLRKISGRLD